jgi:hypothetical protein
MQNSNFWHKLHLRRQKVIAALFFVFAFCSLSAKAQTNNQDWNLPDYDDKLLHYGFQIGVHASGFNLDYSEAFKDTLDGQLQNMQAIMKPTMPGFSLGFILNLHLHNQIDLRFLPKVGFYEYRLDYIYAEGNADRDPDIISQTNVEFPLMLKYKSQRRGNTRMYITGGINPVIRASHKGYEDIEESEQFRLKGSDLKLELGVGLDQYFPLFKFSPELRYSYGLKDVLDLHDNQYHDAIDRLNTHSFTLYLNFE